LTEGTQPPLLCGPTLPHGNTDLASVNQRRHHSAVAVKTLEDAAGITGDEAKDTQIPKFRITTPESIADNVGELAGNK
jgi:hypothetical protein